MESRVYIDDKNIYVDGQKTKIVSGAIHYFRVHPTYWEDRLLKLKEMGCNCVETYVCWNLHEKREGEFDFSGWLDFCKFLSLAKSMGLYAIVRPGPFICSEWDLGGLPWWLLTYPQINLRCADPLFLSKCEPYLKKVCALIRPYLIDNGGNIIMVQVENEYAGYGNDKKYLAWLRDLYISEGINCPLVTSDGEGEYSFLDGAVEGVYASINYRFDSIKWLNFLKEKRQNQPGMVMELWNGRAQLWGEPFIRRDVDEVKKSVETALERAELINLYMFHGGTTFGFMNGSQPFEDRLAVNMSSYDVDAPVNEFGERTEKYYAEQEAICKALDIPVVNTAVDPQRMAYGQANFISKCSLSAPLVRKSYSSALLTMEQYSQGYGYIVYTTKISSEGEGVIITLPEVRDIAHVYVDGKYARTIDRYDSDKRVTVHKSGDINLAILVENLGRTKFGVRLKDFKGLVGNIIVENLSTGGSAILFGFDAYSIELDCLPESYDGKVELNAPAFYKYEFTAREIKDTVLRPIGFTRGVAFINGFNLGRHWAIENSDNRLFIPAPLLKEGKNEIVIFDALNNDSEKRVELTTE